MFTNIRKDVALRQHTTYRIGGPAQYYVSVDNLKELRDALQWCQETGVSWFVLGHGSNILVADEGFPGLVLVLGEGFQHIQFHDEQSVVSAGGGCSLPKLGRRLASNGWAGFEFMNVIPGTVGAAVRINAGTTYEGEMKDCIHAVQVLGPDLLVKTFTRDELNFSYRSSRLTENKAIVLNAAFRLAKRDSVKTIQKKIKRIRDKRNQRHPKNHRNCGSVFKKPEHGKSAGWYIEQTGLKGRRIGGAQVALEHANWIVNAGSATAADVKELIRLIQESVFARFDVMLEREVIYIPEDLRGRDGYGG